MSIQSRLKRAEKLLAAVLPKPIPPPSDVPAQLWQRALELLRLLPDDELYHNRAGFLLKLHQVARGQELFGYPKPIWDCVFRAMCEVEEGWLPPPNNERGRMLLADLGNWSDDELSDILRQIDKQTEEFFLPQPYSTWLLDELTPRFHGLWYLKGKLERGEITREEYDARVAAKLPPVTRIGLEKAVVKIGERALGTTEESYVAAKRPKPPADSREKSGGSPHADSGAIA